VKKIVYILSFFVLFKPLFPLVEYAVNYDYISETLCINKEKPIMACNGKCYLMSELTKSFDTNEAPVDKKISTNKTEISFFEDFKAYNFSFVFIKKNENQKYSYYSNLYSFLKETCLLHPPNFIA
jgi:hypothetical protein